MPHSNDHKIDPRLRRSAEIGCVPAASDASGYTCWLDPTSNRPRSTAPTTDSQRDRYAEVFIEVADSGTLEWLKSQSQIPESGIKNFVNLVDGYCSAIVRLDRLGPLGARPGVMELEAVRFLQPQLDLSVDSIHGWDGLSRNNPARQSQGSGVVIGIVDYGLDYTLDDFQSPKGKTRVEYLWDQQLNPALPGEKPPTKYGYGVEYRAAEINEALKLPDPFTLVRHRPLEADSDVSGHGTHVAGIAAGNGTTSDVQYPPGEYVGVAPAATIVFVHLDRKAILRQVSSRRGTLANSINLAHAIAYCFEKADELKMPCVVNLSMGFNGGGHDGNMAVEWIIDALLQKAGRAVVAAAGNEDERRIHYSGRIKQGKRITIGWEHGDFLPSEEGTVFYDDPSTNEMEIWYSTKSKLHVRLLSPSGQASSWVAPGGTRVRFEFTEGERVTTTSEQSTRWHGDARILVELSRGTRDGIRFGTWTLEVEGAHAAPEEAEKGVRFDAWIERTMPLDAPPYMRSRFEHYESNTAITLTTPSTARSVIAVASYACGDPTLPISTFSGRGPTRDGRRSPDLAAPGEPIFSSNARAGEHGAPARRELRGTSMSAPHVTGVVARLLSRQRYLTANEIRTLLVDSADDVTGGRTWDPKWGNGKINASRAMQLLERLLA
jgi:subtilisin family serine protease